ncbi:hypothetical protein B0H14DRAFT_2617547 [Mycena olivaceomarginata]|nr:hypothetical protein B0H14DRAFT_2617547 [Mycena olivaceomarginata]
MTEKSGSKSCVMSILSISSSYVDEVVYLVQIYRYFSSGIEPVNSTINDSTATTAAVASFRRKVATTVYYKAFHYLEVSGIRTTKYEALVEDFVSDDIVRRAIAIAHLNSLTHLMTLEKERSELIQSHEDLTGVVRRLHQEQSETKSWYKEIENRQLDASVTQLNGRDSRLRSDSAAELHIDDLEAKIAQLEANTNTLQNENAGLVSKFIMRRKQSKRDNRKSRRNFSISPTCLRKASSGIGQRAVVLANAEEDIKSKNSHIVALEQQSRRRAADSVPKQRRRRKFRRSGRKCPPNLKQELEEELTRLQNAKEEDVSALRNEMANLKLELEVPDPPSSPTSSIILFTSLVQKSNEDLTQCNAQRRKKFRLSQRKWYATFQENILAFSGPPLRSTQVILRQKLEKSLDDQRIYRSSGFLFKIQCGMPAFLHIYGHLEIELASAVTSHCREIVDDLEHEKDVLTQEKHALLHEKDILLQERVPCMVIPLWGSNQTKRGTNTPGRGSFDPQEGNGTQFSQENMLALKSAQLKAGAQESILALKSAQANLKRELEKSNEDLTQCKRAKEEKVFGPHEENEIEGRVAGVIAVHHLASPYIRPSRPRPQVFSSAVTSDCRKMVDDSLTRGEDLEREKAILSQEKDDLVTSTK